MLRIDTSHLDRNESRLFLDYLSAAIASAGHPQTGEASFDDDGTFVAELDGRLIQGEEEFPITWTVRRVSAGTIPFVDLAAQEGAELNATWEAVGEAFILEVLESTLARDTETFFQRTACSYIGPQLDGEYWFAGTRVGPYPPDDPGRGIWGRNEQTVLIDQEVDAIDQAHASKVASGRAHRFMARVSLLLGYGLFRPLPEFRWVRHRNEEGQRAPERQLVGNLPPIGHRVAMPGRGEESKAGELRGTILTPASHRLHKLYFPTESELILDRLSSAPANVEEGFDRCSQLYNVGLVIGRRFPTAGLAYTVAAVDALASAVLHHGQFKAFVREHLDLGEQGNALVDRLWGRLRSAHFHGGQFPLGDFASRGLDLTDVEQFEVQREFGAGHHLLRAAIMSWVFRTLVLPEAGS